MQRRPRFFHVRPTRFGIGVVALGAALALSGINIGSGWVVIIAALCFSVVVTDYILTVRTHRRTAITNVDIDLGGSSAAPNRVVCTLNRPTNQVRTIIEWSPTTTDEDDSTPLRSSALATGPLYAAGSLPRGRYRQLKVTLFSHGPLAMTRGTTRSRITVNATVFPRVFSVGQRATAAGSASGDGTERDRLGDHVPKGLREFQPEDGVRRIHWRATAKHQRLMVTERDAEATPAMQITFARGGWSRPALDLAATVAGSFATHLAETKTVYVNIDGVCVHELDDVLTHLAVAPPAIGVPPRPLLAATNTAGLLLEPMGNAVTVTHARGLETFYTVDDAQAWLAR